LASHKKLFIILGVAETTRRFRNTETFQKHRDVSETPRRFRNTKLLVGGHVLKDVSETPRRFRNAETFQKRRSLGKPT
jgi:hypothetical protein